MADKKITELNAWTTAIDTDVVPIVDVTAGETKKITKGNLFKNANTLEFNLTPSVSSPNVVGRLYWDATNKTVAVDLTTSGTASENVTMQLGQEEFLYVKKATSGNIANGEAVYISGSASGIPTVELAKADSAATSYVTGIATQTITGSGGFGYVNVRGMVHDLNTNTWTVGDLLYLSGATAGALTNVKPSTLVATHQNVTVGRVITKDPTAGVIYVRAVTPIAIEDLSNAVIASPAADEVLRWNGTAWVNGVPVTSSASTGIEFFQATPEILGVGNNNQRPVSTLSKTPVTTAEQTVSMSLASDTKFGRAFLYDTALGRTVLDGGVWDFTTYAGVNSVSGGRVTTVTRNVYQVIPGQGTLSTVRTAGSAVATQTNTTGQFASGDATASLITCGYLQTPQGLYEITAFSNSKVVTITVPNGGTPYADETNIAAGNWRIWRLVVTSTTPTITSISTAYGQYDKSVAYGNITIAATDKLGSIIFGTSNNTTTLTTTYDGTARNTHVATPLITLHNNLAGLNAGDYTHLSAAEKSGLTGGGSTALHTHGATVSVTTKGDLQGYSTVPDRLPVGTNGQVLEARSTEATGLKWIDAPGSSSFIYNEVPSGAVNGTNTAFDTANNYVSGSIQVYKDGQLMKGGGADYTETDANTITFTTAPVTGSVLLVTYQKTVSTAGNADTLDGEHLSTIKNQLNFLVNQVFS